MDEIIYVCNSVNNKNVRAGELEILRKYEDKLYFEFGADEMNIKKRFYNDIETLNKDFDAISALKDKMKDFDKLEEEPKEIEELKNETLSKETEEVQKAVLKDLFEEKEEKKEKKEEPKKVEKKSRRKNNLF